VRIATFDVGTNTVLASVVERSAGADALISDHALIARLGEGVDRRGQLSEAAIRRALDALEKLATEARSRGATYLVGVGTSALRDAQNRDAFVEPARALLDGFDVVDGSREAALTFRGALFGLPFPAGELTVVDIGGGSTEIVRGQRGVAETGTSVDVGSVRLFERHLQGVDRPATEALARVRADIDRALGSIVIRPPLLMLAGTATNVASVALGLDVARGAPVPHGRTLPARALLDAVARITTASADERREMIGIEPGREDVIVAGALLLEAIVLRADATEVLVSDGGVRFGLALEHLDASDRRPPEPC
jgi:exopolyphosphatase/guanosine-5'-triphosphate,3'-diphosphate pyrophosphatase